MTSDTARHIVDQAVKNAGRDRLARIAAGVLTLCLLVAGVYFGPRVVSQGQHIDQLQTSYDRSNDAANKLADQVRAPGATPAVQPPPVAATSTASVDPAALRAAARAALDDYCASRNQCRGADGTTPNFDLIVDAVVAKIPTPRDGRDAPTPDYAALIVAYCGQAGEPCRGPTGAKGDKGDPGAAGAAGAAGPTCPEGYVLHDAIITASDGTTYHGKACVDPSSSTPPSSDPPLPLPGG